MNRHRPLVLISCPHVIASVELVESPLRTAGIEWEIASVRGQQLTEAELLPIIGQYDGVLAGDDEFTARVLSAAARLRVISKWGVGVDSIDLGAARELGIGVRNTPGMFGPEIADYALGYIILLHRKLHVVDGLVRRGKWPCIRGHSIAGRALGIIGLGSSGRELARRAVTLGMKVLGNDVLTPPVEFIEETGVRLMSVEELLSSSDIVSLHVPLTSSTRGLIGRDALALMRPGCMLINIARGGLVEEDALVDAVECGHVAGAALDVFEQEPLPVDHRLASLDAVILGAHNASNTYEAVRRTTEEAVRNLVDGLGVHHG